MSEMPSSEEFSAFYYQLHGRRVQRYIESRFRLTREDAGDFVHEAFLCLHAERQRLSAVDPDGILRFLLRVVRNTVIDHFRRHEQSRRAHKSPDQLYENESDESLRDSAAVFQNPWPELEDKMSDNAIKPALLPVLNRLSCLQRSCLLLRLQGYSLNEISNKLGIRDKMVSAHVVRATQKLRAAALEFKAQPGNGLVKVLTESR